MRSRPRPWAASRDSEAGSAVVEFLTLAFVMLIPLTYLLLAFFEIQGAAFAAQGAARDAARLMAASRSEAAGRAAAQVAVEVAFDDAGLPPPGAVTINCSANPCLTGGASIHVAVDLSVPLPLLPQGFSDALGAHVPVRGTAVQTVDVFVDRS